MERIEYSIRPVPRFAVTSFRRNEEGTCALGNHGEFADEETAFQVGCALAKAEQEREGWGPFDERIQFPTRPSEATTVRVENNDGMATE